MTPSSDQSARLSRGSAILDILIVVAVSAAAYFAEAFARDAGLVPLGEDSRGLFAVIAGTVTCLALVFARGGSWRTLGFRSPGPWWRVLLWAVGILAAYAAVQALAPLLVSRFVELPEPDLSRHAAVAGNLGAAVFMALVLPFSASIPEEIVYRGFLMNRLATIFGAGSGGAVLTVAVQALIFGSVHFGWGVGGMIVTTMMGAVWGAAFLLCGRNLWIVIVAHTLGHLLLVAQLYAATPP